MSPIVIQGNTLLGAALSGAYAVGKMYRQGKVEEDKIKQMPSFFYWQITKGQ
jgi:hypothetical protein